MESGQGGASTTVQKRTPNAREKEEAKALVLRRKDADKTYGRGRHIRVRAVKDKKLRSRLTVLETKFQTAALRAKDAEILLENTPGCLEPETELERTYQVRQDDIQSEVSLETAQKRFDLRLDVLGPYICEYSRNGRELLLAGRKGHIATVDWREGKLICERQLGESIRDIKWLHNNQYFAVAQKKFTYIYDRDGVELHCLQRHRHVTHMEFLPYHFLLATLSASGMLKYQDTSTGNVVTEIATKLGPPMSVAQNPWNAVLHVGQQDGTVTLWSPNTSTPLVKLLAHRGPVRALAVNRDGRYMVSAGQDARMAVWDIRTFKEVGNHPMWQPASSVAISDTGLTGVGWGTHTTIWKGLFSTQAATLERAKGPYMAWGGEGQKMERLRWCPYEDVLGIGHDQGFSSILVPGAGEPNFDGLEANPFETHRQRQEGEVKALLNKLQPEMIALDPNFIGNLDLRSAQQRQADRDLDAAAAPVDLLAEIRNRSRGKNTALKKYRRKQQKKNVIDEKSMKVEELWKEQKKVKERQEVEEDLGPALSRFVRRKG